MNRELHIFTILDIFYYLKTTVPNNALQQPCWGRLFQTGDLQGEFVFCPKVNEKQIWAQTLTIHTIAAYEAYLQRFAVPFYEKEAILFLAKEAREFAENEKEERAWQEAETLNTEASYFAYCKQCVVWRWLGL